MPDEIPAMSVIEQRDMLHDQLVRLFTEMGVPPIELNVRHSKDDLMEAVKSCVHDDIMPQVVVLGLMATAIAGFRAAEAERN